MIVIGAAMITIALGLIVYNKLNKVEVIQEIQSGTNHVRIVNKIIICKTLPNVIGKHVTRFGRVTVTQRKKLDGTWEDVSWSVEQ